MLGFGALPLWLAAGGADWLCHRRSGIERTSGPTESALHLLLFGQIAVPASLALFFEINALLLTLMAAGVAAHMFTSWWDTRFAQPRRHIAPIEQQIHSWQEMLPLFALVVIVLLHPLAFSSDDWTLQARPQPVDVAWRVGVLGGFAIGVAFIAEEYWRCVRHRRVHAQS